VQDFSTLLVQGGTQKSCKLRKKSLLSLSRWLAVRKRIAEYRSEPGKRKKSGFDGRGYCSDEGSATFSFKSVETDVLLFRKEALCKLLEK